MLALAQVDRTSISPQLDEHALLRSLLWLPSSAAFSLRASCASLSRLLGDDDSLLRFWRASCSICKHQACGVIGRDMLWLHALVEASSISRFVDEVGRFSILGDIKLREQRELAELTAGMRRLESEVASSPNLAGDCFFAGPYTFNHKELFDLLHRGSGDAGSPASVRSSAVRFATFSEYVRFDLYLVISVVGQALALSWECALVGDMLMEARDCLELSVVGGAWACDAGEAQHVAVHPFSLSLGSGASVAASAGLILPEDPLWRALLREGAAHCSVHLDSRSMGLQQLVVPDLPKQSVRSAQDVGSLDTIDCSAARPTGSTTSPSNGALVPELHLEVSVGPAAGGVVGGAIAANSGASFSSGLAVFDYGEELDFSSEDDMPSLSSNEEDEATEEEGDEELAQQGLPSCSSIFKEMVEDLGSETESLDFGDSDDASLDFGSDEELEFGLQARRGFT